MLDMRVGDDGPWAGDIICRLYQHSVSNLPPLGYCEVKKMLLRSKTLQLIFRKNVLICLVLL